MRRVVVLGGTGFFGAAAVERLRADGLEPMVAARHGIAELRLDVSSRASVKEALRPFDVVVDAVGPYPSRSTALIEAAIETGFDVIDLSDSLEYAEKVEGLRLRIEAAGIRVFRDGRLVHFTGWREARAFRMPRPLGRTRGFLCESADGFLLPRVWPSLRRVDFYVHSGATLLDGTLSLASRSSAVRRLIARTRPPALPCRACSARRPAVSRSRSKTPNVLSGPWRSSPRSAVISPPWRRRCSPRAPSRRAVSTPRGSCRRIVRSTRRPCSSISSDWASMSS